MRRCARCGRDMTVEELFCGPCNKFIGKEMQGEFVTKFNHVQTDIHKNAINKGWWNEDKNEGECIALMHSELSEALEALRNGSPDDEHCPQFKNVEVELADVVIRVMDLSEAKGYRLGEAIIAKSEYNKGREYRHGKLF